MEASSFLVNLPVKYQPPGAHRQFFFLGDITHCLSVGLGQEHSLQGTFLLRQMEGGLKPPSVLAGCQLLRRGAEGIVISSSCHTTPFEDKNFLQSELCHKFAKKQHDIIYQKTDGFLSVLLKLFKTNN